MDTLLCDELIQEVFQRLPESSSAAVSLVSRRWLHLHRSSQTSLSLHLHHHSPLSSLSSLLSQSPSLSSLSVLSADPTTATLSAQILSHIHSFCPNLQTLRFSLTPISLSSLVSLSSSCSHLTSISINLSRPLNLRWVLNFPSLKSLSATVLSGDGAQFDLNPDCETDAELGLESLCISGLRHEDSGAGWLWRSSTKLQKLHLRGCETLGDGGSFTKCLPELREVELRTCRSIIDGVLLKLAENCRKLSSLLVYDGGNRDGLLRFISGCRSNLQNLDLRLPLDLANDHLSAVAANLRGLSSLRLQSCCLVTGDGLKAIGTALNSQLQELGLINCDVVERESGLLATIGQNLRKLKKLDLSYNEMLVDKDFISMIVSCKFLTELNLRGCKKLSAAAVAAATRSCRSLEAVDIVQCAGIEAAAVEICVVNLPKLRRIKVEESKVSDHAKNLAARRFVEVVV